MNRILKLAIVSLAVIGVLIYWMFDRQQKLDQLRKDITTAASTETKGWSIEKELQGLSADGPKYFFSQYPKSGFTVKTLRYSDLSPAMKAKFPKNYLITMYNSDIDSDGMATCEVSLTEPEKTCMITTNPRWFSRKRGCTEQKLSKEILTLSNANHGIKKVMYGVDILKFRYNNISINFIVNNVTHNVDDVSFTMKYK
jgi:hypothetical protein